MWSFKFKLSLFLFVLFFNTQAIGSMVDDPSTGNMGRAYSNRSSLPNSAMVDDPDADNMGITYNNRSSQANSVVGRFSNLTSQTKGRVSIHYPTKLDFCSNEARLLVLGLARDNGYLDGMGRSYSEIRSLTDISSIEKKVIVRVRGSNFNYGPYFNGLFKVVIHLGKDICQIDDPIFIGRPLE